MDRRRSAVIRIVAWSITAVVLVIILILGLNGRIRGFNFGVSTGYTYRDAGKYQAGAGEIDGDKVRDLDVNWLDGEVKVEVYDGDTVKFQEKSNRKLKEKEQMHYYNKGGRLIIQYRGSDRKLLSLGDGITGKELIIQIPAKNADDFGLIRIDTVSSDNYITGVAAKEISLDSTSGDFQVDGCHADELDMSSTSGGLTGQDLHIKDELNTDTTSGSVDVEGSFGSINSNTVSGEMVFDSDKCPKKVVTDGISGSVILTIPENEGFKYKKDTVSGSIDCEFAVKQNEDHGTYKNGGARFTFDSVSGDVTIRKR